MNFRMLTVFALVFCGACAKEEVLDAPSARTEILPAYGFSDFDGVLLSSKDILYSGLTGSTRDSLVVIKAALLNSKQGEAILLDSIAFDSLSLTADTKGVYAYSGSSQLKHGALNTNAIWRVGANEKENYDAYLFECSNLKGYPSVPVPDTLLQRIDPDSGLVLRMLDTLGNMAIVGKDVTTYVVFSVIQGDRVISHRQSGASLESTFAPNELVGFKEGEAMVEIAAYRAKVRNNYYHQVLIANGARVRKKVEVQKKTK